MMPDYHLPVFVREEVVENVLDARCCILSGCRFFQQKKLASKRIIGYCKADVYRAELPIVELNKEIQRNSDPTPGSDKEVNPFLLRLLMSPDCVRPECGVSQVEYIRTVLSLSEEQRGQLFK
jgi:hypothetical protein